MTQPSTSPSDPPGLVWIDCPYPVAGLGLARILETDFRVHIGREPPPAQVPTVAILGVGRVEGLLEGVKRIRTKHQSTLILVFGLHLDLAAAQAALRAGARGFIHAGMTTEQVSRAAKVALEGEIVAPRQLLEYLISNEDTVDLNILSVRQQEILELVADGLTNDQIAKKLYVSESTIKQHLRASYKALGVKIRTEATKLLRKKADQHASPP